MIRAKKIYYFNFLKVFWTAAAAAALGTVYYHEIMQFLVFHKIDIKTNTFSIFQNKISIINTSLTHCIEDAKLNANIFSFQPWIMTKVCKVSNLSETKIENRTTVKLFRVLFLSYINVYKSWKFYFYRIFKTLFLKNKKKGKRKKKKKNEN